MKVYKNSEIIRKTVISGAVIALAMVLPFITGGVPTVGKMLSPMHISAYLAGALLGPLFGGGVAFICPLLRSLIFGAPALFPRAIAMCFELFAYAFVFGLLIKLLPKRVFSLYAALVTSMLSGRLVGGAAKLSFLLLGLIGEYPFAEFLSAYFVGTWLSVIIQLAVIVPILYALSRAGVFKYDFKKKTSGS
jgi:hypothetical protein